MERRGNVGLSSTWQASEDLHCALYTMNNSGLLLDEPFSSEQEKCLILVQLVPETPCYLHVDVSGYCISSLALTSSSRTVEVYRGGDEYVGTARGSYVSERENGFKLYTCELELSPEDIYTKLSLKLLSLRGKSEVLVEKLQLVVTEDHRGTRMPSVPMASGMSQFDPQQLLESLPTHNLPPFLTSLVSSLQHLQTQCHEGPPSPQLPPELSQLTTALKEMRPPTTTTTATTDTVTDTDRDIANGGMDHVEVDGITVSALEERLQRYIDEKFIELQRQVDERFEQLTQRVLEQLVANERSVQADEQAD